MINSKSYKQIKDIKKSLKDIEDSIESAYFQIQREVNHEQDIRIKQNAEFYKRGKAIWKILNHNVKVRLMKNSLPRSITMFNRIDVHGSELGNKGMITIFFSFGNRNEKFKKSYSILEIERLIEKLYPNIKFKTEEE